MRNVTTDVLKFLETSIIDNYWLATNFAGRKSLVRDDFEKEFISELDLQEQIEETEVDWNE